MHRWPARQRSAVSLPPPHPTPPLLTQVVANGRQALNMASLNFMNTAGRKEVRCRMLHVAAAETDSSKLPWLLAAPPVRCL